MKKLILILLLIGFIFGDYNTQKHYLDKNEEVEIDTLAQTVKVQNDGRFSIRLFLFDNEQFNADFVTVHATETYCLDIPKKFKILSPFGGTVATVIEHFEPKNFWVGCFHRVYSQSTEFANGIDMWGQELSQGQNYNFLSSARALHATSSSELDTNIVVGVRGLDEDYSPVTEYVNLNGQNNVELASNYIRINRIFVSAGNPQGDISIIDTSDSDKTIAFIEVGHGVSQTTIYSVPRGRTAKINFYSCSFVDQGSFSGNETVSFFVLLRYKTDIGYTPFMLVMATGTKEGAASSSGTIDLEEIPEKSDIKVVCTKSSISGNPLVFFGYSIVLE